MFIDDFVMNEGFICLVPSRTVGQFSRSGFELGFPFYNKKTRTKMNRTPKVGHPS